MYLLTKKIIILFSLFLFTFNAHSLIYPIPPKYASIKKDKAYLRYNASFQAPISHIYSKKGLPILIINEHDNWKKIVGTDLFEACTPISFKSLNNSKVKLITYLSLFAERGGERRVPSHENIIVDKDTFYFVLGNWSGVSTKLVKNNIFQIIIDGSHYDQN